MSSCVIKLVRPSCLQAITFGCVEALGGSFAEVTAKSAKELRIDGGIQVTSIKEGEYSARPGLGRVTS